MKTRLHEGGTERCELSTPSPRARYGIKVAEGGNDGTFDLTLLPKKARRLKLAYSRKSAGSDKLLRRYSTNERNVQRRLPARRAT